MKQVRSVIPSNCYVSLQWAFGISLWELFSRGKRPFFTVETCDLHKQMEKGERPEQPACCPVNMYVFHPERESFTPSIYISQISHGACLYTKEYPNFCIFLSKCLIYIKFKKKLFYLPYIVSFDEKKMKGILNTLV